MSDFRQGASADPLGPRAGGRPQPIEMPEWLRPLGHVGGVSARGRLVFLAGQLGWDERSRIVGPDLVSQARQALRNVVSLLERAGAAPQHITHMTWYLTRPDEYERQLPAIAIAYSELIGREFPPMTTVAVNSLMCADACIAIDATAVVGDDA